MPNLKYCTKCGEELSHDESCGFCDEVASSQNNSNPAPIILLVIIPILVFIVGFTIWSLNKSFFDSAPVENTVDNIPMDILPEQETGFNGDRGNFICGDNVTYGGEMYPTVKIGNQCWFQKNLNIGIKILGTINQTNNKIIEKYCYNDDNSKCNFYGGLYQWDEAMQYSTSERVKGICPEGWHIPSNDDWDSLISHMSTLPSENGNPGQDLDNSSGFTNVNSGIRYKDGDYINNGAEAAYVTSYYKQGAISFVDYNQYQLPQIHPSHTTYKYYGLSIRCLKD